MEVHFGRLRKVDSKTFCSFAVRLTGVPVKDVGESDLSLLEQILADDNRAIDRSQLNELLLLVNKDRMGKPMFRYFFGESCRVSDLEPAVKRYQQVAMLQYGNFVFAYRTLSRILDVDQFSAELGALYIEGDHSADRYSARAEKLLEVQNIPRDDTSLVGYLSATQIVAEAGRSKLLSVAARAAGEGASWDRLEIIIRELSKPDEQQPLIGMIENYRSRYPGRMPLDFSRFVEEIAPEVESRYARLKEVQMIATRNPAIPEPNFSGLLTR